MPSDLLQKDGIPPTTRKADWLDPRVKTMSILDV
jgi:hypothetical protein